ncbi:hypothetical protein IU459_11985 [Nocardia amamiensis]|uniref:Uncharacterized protein n=1 Tax=Nocardia amamiensis TaxID=404578 RepID=A0ABS0CNQ6_9NOCA|nr:hypothetical protein [Nocardia amamiensis]MBF6298261.1 hypothetical protein [Nocardia amamiensis]
MPDLAYHFADADLRRIAEDPNTAFDRVHKQLAAELLDARQRLTPARLSDEDLTSIHRGLVDHARSHMHVDTDDEQRHADNWLSGYSEGIEHALDTVRLRAHAAAPSPEPSGSPAEPPTAQSAPPHHGNSATVTSGSPFVPPMPPAQARRQLLSPFDYPAGLTDDDARRAGEIVAGYLDDVLDRVDLACADDLGIGDEGERAVLGTLGVIAVEAARCLGWRPPSGATGEPAAGEVEAIAVAWMRYQGYTDQQIETAATHNCADTCERAGDAWDCTDEHGESRHPIADELAAASAMANVALKALAEHRPPIGWITGHRHADGKWHIAFDGEPWRTLDEANVDVQDASTETPDVDWRALTVYAETGEPHQAQEVACLG